MKATSLLVVFTVFMLLVPATAKAGSDRGYCTYTRTAPPGNLVRSLKIKNSCSLGFMCPWGPKDLPVFEYGELDEEVVLDCVIAPPQPPLDLPSGTHIQMQIHMDPPLPDGMCRVVKSKDPEVIKDNCPQGFYCPDYGDKVSQHCLKSWLYYDCQCIAAVPQIPPAAPDIPLGPPYIPPAAP